VDIEAVFSLIQLNGKSAIMVIARDISQRKELERDLADSEERFRKMVERSPFGVAIHDFGTFIYVNPVGVKCLGAHTADELIGKNVLDFVHPNYHEFIRERWKIEQYEDSPVQFLEEKMIRLDNQLIDVEIAGLPIELNGKRLTQIFF
jgi:PAS domain S-box-containing protein